MDIRTRGVAGFTGMHDLLVRRVDSDGLVGRPWALFGRRAWQKLVFFRGLDEGGGGGEGGLVRGDGVHARCRGRWMALGVIWMGWGDVCACLAVVDGGWWM